MSVVVCTTSTKFVLATYTIAINEIIVRFIRHALFHKRQVIRPLSAITKYEFSEGGISSPGVIWEYLSSFIPMMTSLRCVFCEFEQKSLCVLVWQFTRAPYLHLPQFYTGCPLQKDWSSSYPTIQCGLMCFLIIISYGAYGFGTIK